MSQLKIWGERRRILLDDKNEIDLLYLKKNSFCSWHKHLEKINRFILVSGKVSIITEFGTKELKINEPFDVLPPLKHRFVIQEDSVMIEMAYVEKGNINPDDITRIAQGGRILKGVYLTIPELEEKGFLDLKE